MDSNDFRRIMGGFPTGVSIVTTAVGGVPHGMTANAIAPVSLQPLQMLFCAQKTARTHDMIRQSGCFAINFLRLGMEELSDRFASRNGSEDDRFADLPYFTAASGAPVLCDNLGWLDCRVTQEIDGGDHTIFLAEVVDGAPGDGAPLVFCRGKYMTIKEA